MTDEQGIDELLDKANDALDRGDLNGARAALKQLESVAGDDRDVLLLKALVCAAERKGDDALAAVGAALEHNPDDPLLLVTRASFLMDFNDDAIDALPLLEEAVLTLEEDEPQSDEDDDEEATAEAWEAWQSVYAEALLLLSECRSALDDNEAALAAAQEAVELTPESAEAQVARARVLFDMCEVAQAEAAIEEALNIDGNHAAAHWLLGRVHTVRGHTDLADASFAEAAELDPTQFYEPVRLDEEAFKRVLAEAIDAMPKNLQAYVKAAPLTVEEIPSVDVLMSREPPLSPSVMVFVQGEPRDPRTQSDMWAHRPDAILVFQRNLEVASASVEEMRELAQAAIALEIGRFLGLEEDEDEGEA